MDALATWDAERDFVIDDLISHDFNSIESLPRPAPNVAQAVFK